MSEQGRDGFFSRLKRKLKRSSGLSSTHEGVSQVFGQMSETNAKEPQAVNAALGASLIVAAVAQLPPDIAAQIMDFVQTSFSQLSHSVAAQGLIPQAGAVVGLGTGISSMYHKTTDPEGETPVAKLRKPFGLISAYWLSEKWCEAWGLTLGVFGLKTLHSASSVGMALSTAELISEVAQYSPDDPEKLAAVAAGGGAVAAYYLGRKAMDEGGHFLQAQLHRLSARWDAAQFRDALAIKGVLPSLTRQMAVEGKAKVPENIDAILDDPLVMLKADVMQLSLGVWGAAGTLWFMSREVLERSQKVEFLDNWANDFHALAAQYISPEIANNINLAPGEYGTAVLAAGTMALYVVPMTWAAYKMSKWTRSNQKQMMEAFGRRRSHLQDTLKNSHLTAASEGEGVYRELDERS